MHLYASYVQTPLGSMNICCNDSEVTAVTWVDTPNPPMPQSALSLEAAKQVSAYFEGSLVNFDLPLQFPDTKLVAAVMRKMLSIPYGKTRTYGDLAQELGTGPRPIGRACGQNPIPIIVPCHRVVGASGRLTGFSGAGGIETKAYLLSLEANQRDLFV